MDSNYNDQTSDTKGYELITLINVPVFNAGCLTSLSISYGYHQYLTFHTEYSLVDNKILSNENNSQVGTCNYNCKGDHLGNAASYMLADHVNNFRYYASVQRLTKQRVTTLDYVLANLLHAYSANCGIVYSRNRSDNVKVVKEVVDYLTTTGYVTHYKGHANEYDNIASTIHPTSKLLANVKAMGVRVGLKQGAVMIEVRGKDKQPLKLSAIQARQPAKLKTAIQSVDIYNDIWTRHEATLDNKYLTPYCKRIFNGDLAHGGRFYGASHLQMKKKDRQRILIDGMQTSEPDFKAMHYCLLYTMVGQQLEPLEDDPYTIEGYSRDTIKLASLVLINCNSFGSFKAMITKSGNINIKRAVSSYKTRYLQYEDNLLKGIKTRQPVKPDACKGYIRGVPDGTKGDHLLDAILTKHSAIKHLFCRNSLGTKLQNTDSAIMAKTLSMLCSDDLPALPVHDSVICRLSDLATVREAMAASYKDVTKGFDCYIT